MELVGKELSKVSGGWQLVANAADYGALGIGKEPSTGKDSRFGWKQCIWWIQGDRNKDEGTAMAVENPQIIGGSALTMAVKCSKGILGNYMDGFISSLGPTLPK